MAERRADLPEVVLITGTRKGIGKALLKHLAQRCVEEGLPRLQWWVLDWNAPSIEFYKSLGAVPQDEWTVFRVSGEALDKLAAK